LTGLIDRKAGQIDQSLPAVLAAHVWVMNAKIGSEKGMSIGQEHMLMPSSVANPAFDYVALGHIHKGQVLNENPPVVYSGSLERLDFGDEEDEKGFYVVEIENNPAGGKTTTFRFHPVKARRFFTLKIEIAPDETDPTEAVLRKVGENLADIEAAIVRIEISLPPSLSTRLRDAEIARMASGAAYLTITRETKREIRLRLGKSNLEGISPAEALKAFLESKYPPERARILLAEGEALIREYNQTDKG
jgi:exonuclease SbcD